MPAPAPPPDGSRETHPLVTRFGTLAGLATAAAVAGTLPAALRVTRALEGAESTVHVWASLAAAVLLPMMALVAVLGRAREAWRAFGGPGRVTYLYGAATWLALLVLGLSLFGRLLRATTHQHALAAVTFALGGLAYGLGAAAICARMVSALRGASPGMRRAAELSVAASLGAAAVLLALACARAAARDPVSAAQAATVVDDLALLLAAALAARRAQAGRRVLALLGPPAAVTLLAVGLPGLRAGPLREAVAQAAPMVAVAARLLVR